MEVFSGCGGCYANVKANLTSNEKSYLQHILALREMINLSISNIDLFLFQL